MKTTSKKDNFKNEDNIKNEDDLKMKMTSKIAPPLQIFLCTPPLKKIPDSFF